MSQKVVTSLNRERLGHYLRSELVFDLDGSGEPPPKRYKLAIAVTRKLDEPDRRHRDRPSRRRDPERRRRPTP